MCTNGRIFAIVMLYVFYFIFRKQSQEGSTASRQVDLNLRLPAYCKGIVVIPCWDDGTKGNKETDTGSFKITTLKRS